MNPAYQIGLLALLAVSSSIAREIPNKPNTEVHANIACFPEFPLVNSFSVTYEDNSTISFDSDIDHIPDEKQVIEYCRSGWWVSHDNFNHRTWYGDAYGFQLNFNYNFAHPLSPSCHTPSASFHTRSIRSARTLGFEDGSPSATFFSDIYFGGERTVFAVGAEIPVLPYEVKSFAVLNTEVIFYEEENFEGDFASDSYPTCYWIGCDDGEAPMYLCNNQDAPGSIYPLPFIPKSAKIVNRGMGKTTV